MTVNFGSSRRVLAAVAAIATSGGLCAGALAASPYTVKVKLPSNTIAPGHSFKAKATGVSPSSSRLTVFLSAKSCATSSKAESSRSAKEVINKSVIHNYASSKTTKAGSTGVYHACAYLTAGSSTRAHFALKYYVLVGGY